MMLSIDSEEGVLKVGSPPTALPGIVDSVQVGGALQIEDADVQGRSGKVKVVRGWEDADLRVHLSLIDDPAKGITRWDALKQVADVFKNVGGSGKPETHTVSHPMVAAWGLRKMLFISLQAREKRQQRVVAVSLDFVEYESASGIVQDRQGADKQATKTNQPAPVPDKTRRGLGSLEKKYAKL